MNHDIERENDIEEKNNIERTHAEQNTHDTLPELVNPDAWTQSGYGLDDVELIDTDDNLPVVIMRTTRRMRSGELHYLDHPVMGILIEFTPL